MSDAYNEAIAKLEGYNPFVDIPKRVCPVENINAATEKWIRGTQTNHVIVVRNCQNVTFYAAQNQRLHTFYFIDCTNIIVIFLDSLVVANRTCRAINCTKCVFIFEDVDIRHFECYNVTETKAVYIDSVPVVENQKVHWREGCANNVVRLGRLRPRGRDDQNHPIEFDVISTLAVPDVPAGECTTTFNEIQQPSNSVNSSAVYPPAAQILHDLEELEKVPFTMTKAELSEAYDREREEYEEPLESVRAKAKEVAELLRNSTHRICYTGAGVSTSANLPDFRGPTGLWTQKAKGVYTTSSFKEEEIRPTLAHYAVTELARRNYINFVISTNMDALHMRSGLPPHLICEQHGNGHKEVCVKCRKAFYRNFRCSYDTDFFTHLTGRYCDFCGGGLRDTIVNFSEVLADEDMLISLHHSRKSDFAIVLGTSMNVQPAASFPEKCLRNNGKVVIVNLQKTPYDGIAAVRVFAKTDVFMKILMEELRIDEFDMTTDLEDTWLPRPGAKEESMFSLDRLKQLFKNNNNNNA